MSSFARSRARLGRALAALVATVLVATGCNLQLLGAPRGSLHLHATFDNVQGLAIGNSVQINNVVVGSVTGIRLDPHSYRAKVEMALQTGRLVPSDATASVQQTTLLGEYYVNVQLPAVDAPGTHTLRSGEAIDGTSASAPVEEVVAKAGELLTAVNPNDLSAIIAAGSQALGGRGPELHDLVGKTSQLLGAFGTQHDEIGTAVDNLAKLGRTLVPLSDQFGSLMDKLSSATTLVTQDRDRFFTALQHFDQLVTTTNDVVIQPHAAQFAQLITEANTILAALNQNTRILSDFADNLATATPKFNRVISQTQLLLAIWGELPRFK